MFLSAKTTLLAFWILCEICVTFTADNEGESSSSSGAEKMLRLLHSKVRTSRLPAAIPPFHSYFSLPKDFISDDEEDTEDETSPENSSEDGYENEEDEDLECKDAIIKKFKRSENDEEEGFENEEEEGYEKEEDEESDAIEKLKFGFFSLNENKFDASKRSYEYTHGYFLDLVNRATNLESSNIWSPRVYCKEEYTSYKNESIEEDCMANIEEIQGIKRDTSGHEAYKIMYLKLDSKLLKIDYIFPDWASSNYTYSDHEVQEDELKKTHKLYRYKLQFISGYFYYLHDQWNTLNYKSLRTPEDFCETVSHE